jgi:hypothetical protein
MPPLKRRYAVATNPVVATKRQQLSRRALNHPTAYRHLRHGLPVSPVNKPAKGL